MAVADRHPGLAELEAFTLGTLDDASLAGVEAHVAACPTCQERAAGASGDTLVELLRRVHAQTARRNDTVAVTAALAQTPAPAPARTEAFTLPPAAPAVADGTAALDGIPPGLARHERYRVRRLLGAGGMGAVYEAEHCVMQRAVALKVINRTYTTSPAAVERFRREVRAAARLSHPNIVTTYDAEDAGDTLFLVMEYVEGVSLARTVKERGPLPVAEACAYARQTALGLQHAHERGMVHRDVKPDNLIRCADGTVKVLDFGLAALTAERSSGITDTNVIMGTPDYMAPEQAADARKADIRSDVYSLGCTLYFLLTGRVPYPADTPLLKILAHREQPLPPLRKVCPEVPPELARVVARMLAKKPEDRYQTPGEVAVALMAFSANVECQTRSGGRKPPRRALAAALLFAGLIAAAGVVYSIKTDNGTIEIRTDDENVKIIAEHNGKQVAVLDPKSKQSWVVDTGAWTIRLDGNPDGLKLELPTTFTLKRGDKQVVTIKRVKRPDFAVEPQAEEKVGEVRWLEGYSDVVWSVAFSPDGRHTLTTGDLNLLCDRATGRLIRRFGERGWFASFSPKGDRILASEKSARFAILWDAASGKEIKRFGGKLGRVCYGFFSPDGRRVAVNHWNKVRVWDVNTGNELAVLSAHHETRPGAVFTPDGKRLLVADTDNSIRAYDTATWKETANWTPLADRVTSLALSPDGTTLLMATTGESRDQDLFVWEVASGKQRSGLRSGSGKAQSCAASFLPDGRHALQATFDGTMILWDVTSGSEVQRWKRDDHIVSVAIAPDGKHALCGTWDKKAFLFRLPELPREKVGEVRRFEGHFDRIIQGELSPDGKYVISAGESDDRTVRLWDARTGKELHRFEGHHNRGIHALACFPDGKRAVSGDWEGVICIWDLEARKKLLQFRHEPARGGWLASVAVSPDGKQVASTGVSDGLVRLWDAQTGKELGRLEHNPLVIAAAFSPDGSRMVTGGGMWAPGQPAEDFSLRLWDVATRKEIRRFKGHQGSVLSLAFTRDGQHILSASSDSTVRLWDVATGHEQHRLAAGLTLAGCHAAIAPDGRRVLTSSEQGAVRLWDIKTGKELHRFTGHTDRSRRVSFSSDGLYALSASEDRTLRLWRLPDAAASRDKP